MRIRVGCEFDYESSAPVPMLLLVRVHPDSVQQTLHESRWTEPEVAVHEYVDAFGNQCWRFTAPVGRFRIRYDVVATGRDFSDVTPTSGVFCGAARGTLHWSKEAEVIHASTSEDAADTAA